jgi:hypothetical protein
MGLYINPPHMTKEEFLNRYAKQISWGEFLDFNHHANPHLIPVCLMDNGPFTAAGIGFNQNECHAFGEIDHRPKKFYTLEKNLITPENAGISQEILERYLS